MCAFYVCIIKCLSFVHQCLLSFVSSNDFFVNDLTVHNVSASLCCLLCIARDLRSTTTTQERIDLFKARCDAFLTLLNDERPWEGIGIVPYFHILADHVPTWIKVCYETLGWSYGMFSSMSGEHFNKVLKFCESHRTNFSGNRFRQIMRYFRVKAFCCTASVFDVEKWQMICLACHQHGHNKKSKSCTMHLSHPPPIFEDIEQET